MENRKSRIDRAYMILSGDDWFDRACKNIPDSSCTNLSLNYVMNIVNGAASKLAEQVTSAKVVLPWLLTAMGVPASLVGFLLLFSLARGVGSLSFQDVTGKTIPKGRRGRMLAVRSMIGGLLTIAVGIGLKTMKSEDEGVAAGLLLLICGALLRRLVRSYRP